MLSLRTHLIVLALAVLGVFGSQKATAATIGHYTPCMVQPVFVAPSISPPVITKAENIAPAFVAAHKQLWILDHADFDKATFVEAVFSPAYYDGCEYQSQTRSKFLAITRPGMLSGTTKPQGSTVASRIFTDAAACCATPAPAPARTTATGGGK